MLADHGGERMQHVAVSKPDVVGIKTSIRDWGTFDIKGGAKMSKGHYKYATPLTPSCYML
jgi:hypothetical protein